MRTFHDLPFLTEANCPEGFILTDHIATVACLAGRETAVKGVILKPDVWSAPVRDMFAEHTVWPLPHDYVPHKRIQPNMERVVLPFLNGGEALANALADDIRHISTAIFAALPQCREGSMTYWARSDMQSQIHTDEGALFATVGLNVGGMGIVAEPKGHERPYSDKGLGLDLALGQEDFYAELLRLKPGYLSFARGRNGYTQKATPHFEHPMPMPEPYARVRQVISLNFYL